MDESSIIEYITSAFENIEAVSLTGTTYFFYDPAQKFPFVTLITNDDHDQASNLRREAVFRLNIGISKATFQALFGSKVLPASMEELTALGYDFTALNQLLPHPVYGRMYWVCILNPDTARFEEEIKPLLAEAYAMAVKKYGSGPFLKTAQ